MAAVIINGGGIAGTFILSFIIGHRSLLSLFFFNLSPTTKIYTLSLHDALPISQADQLRHDQADEGDDAGQRHGAAHGQIRSEEHTSELQSRQYLVCRLLLE